MSDVLSLLEWSPDMAHGRSQRRGTARSLPYIPCVHNEFRNHSHELLGKQPNEFQTKKLEQIVDRNTSFIWPGCIPRICGTSSRGNRGSNKARRLDQGRPWSNAQARQLHQGVTTTSPCWSLYVDLIKSIDGDHKKLTFYCSYIAPNCDQRLHLLGWHDNPSGYNRYTLDPDHPWRFWQLWRPTKIRWLPIRQTERACHPRRSTRQEIRHGFIEPDLASIQSRKACVSRSVLRSC